VVATSGDLAVQVVILLSIVVPVATLAILCWWFWRHRHDEP
jgi:multisubunit Na+/H+ antiporter MnhC subunit